MKTYCYSDIDLHIDSFQYHTLQNTSLKGALKGQYLRMHSENVSVLNGNQTTGETAALWDFLLCM